MLYRQPQFHGLQIEWANPLTRGLGLLMPLRTGRDLVNLVTGASGTATGSPTTDVSTFGTAPLFASGKYIDFPAVQGISGSTQPVTFAWISEGRGTSGYSAILDWLAPGCTNSFLIYRSQADAGYQFAVGPRAGLNIAHFTIGQQANNQPQIFTLVCRGGLGSTTPSDYVLFVNGVRYTTASTTAFGSSGAASSRIGALSGGGDPFEGLISNLHIWGRGLLDPEGYAFQANPWQTVVDPSDQLLLAAAGANFTCTGSGGLTFSGAATAVEANDYAASGAGGLSFSGAATTTSTSDYLASGAGGISFAGAATASVSGGYDFIGAGGLALAGAAGAAFTVNHAFAAGGGITFAGAASAQAGEANVATGSGGLVFSGSADAVNESRRHGGSGGAEDAIRARRIQARTEEEEIALVISVLAAAGVFT